MEHLRQRQEFPMKLARARQEFVIDLSRAIAIGKDTSEGAQQLDQSGNIRRRNGLLEDFRSGRVGCHLTTT